MTGRRRTLQLSACLLGAVLAAPVLATAPAVPPAKATASDPFAAPGAAAAPAAAPSPAPAAAASIPSSAATSTAPSAAATPGAAAPVLPPRQPLVVPAQPMAAASAGSMLQTITGMLLVLGALALFAWAMKRFGPKAQAGAGGLRIVGGLNLGGRERIVLVEVGDQWIVVGASPGRVNALAQLPRQETVPAPLNSDTPVQPAASFAAWLKQTIEQRNAK